MAIAIVETLRDLKFRCKSLPLNQGSFCPIRRHGDPSRLKIWEKAQRSGATDEQADVHDCVKEGGCDVWFTSADQASAKEYIRSCADWARVLNAVAKDMGEVALDEAKGGAGKRVCEWQAHSCTQQQSPCAARAWRQAGH